MSKDNPSSSNCINQMEESFQELEYNEMKNSINQMEESFQAMPDKAETNKLWL